METSRRLRILITEDNPKDAQLIQTELAEHGYLIEYRRVSTEHEMRAALGNEKWDLVTSAHEMVSFDSRRALHVLKESGIDLPFILVSGSIGEIEAVALMRAGVHDYILKNNIARLVPAVERELREAKNRRERREAEFELRNVLSHLDTLLKAAPAGIAFLDSHFRYLRINDAMAEMSGVSAQHCLGKTVSEVVPQLAPLLEPLIQQVLVTRKSILNYEIQMEIPFAPEKHRSWLLSFYPVDDRNESLEQFLGVGVVGVEITERKETQTRLEQAVRSRDEFLSIASHELKTPLTTLKLQTQLRQRNLDRGILAAFNEEKLRAMFETDEKQLRRLTRLIDDMLDISRIDTGKLVLTLETIEVCSLIEEVIERMGPQVAAAGSAIEYENCGSILLNCDPYRIEQVLINLLSNAARYGKGKPIFIKTQVERNKVLIRVEDQGRGIAKEDQSRIFERFERAISVHEVSGLGLGLFIVKQIIDVHRGTISVESEFGKGSTFIVSLPLSHC